MQNDILTCRELYNSGQDTGAYVINMVPGTYTARLILKADGRDTRMLRLFFDFEDGRNIITPVFSWQNYFYLRDVPIGSIVSLTYEDIKQGIFLTKAEVIETPD